MRMNFTSFRVSGCVILSLLLQFSAAAQSQPVSTIAGGSSGSGIPASMLGLPQLTAIATDAAGNYYIAVMGMNPGDNNGMVCKIDVSGTATIVAGGMAPALTEVQDGTQATSGTLSRPIGIAVDASGNVYISENGTGKVRMVNTSGTISTAAGNGVTAYNGDGIPATQAGLSDIRGIAVDAAGNLYIADESDQRIRMVNLSGVISTVAGSGGQGYNGDGIAATSAQLNMPAAVFVDASGNIYISDASNDRIREVTTDGIIHTLAGLGNSNAGFSGDGGPGISAMVNLGIPTSLTVDAQGTVYFSDNNNNRVRTISSGGTIQTLAGTGVAGYSGDGGAAAGAQLNGPTGVALDASGNVLVLDAGNKYVRKINSGNISTAAGNGSITTGNGGLATNSVLINPRSICTDNAGNTYFTCTEYVNQVFKISPSGMLTTIAGTGAGAISGDGGPAIAAALNDPNGLYVDASGNLYVGAYGGASIRKIDPTGIITKFAGGSTTSTGDGGPATSSGFGSVRGITGDAAGNIYFVDHDYFTVRKIDPNGIITTFAGMTGLNGYTGDGGPATSAKLNSPTGIASDAVGNIYVSMDYPNVVRKIDTNGIITTVAGNANSNYYNEQSYSGDGGPAVNANFGDLQGVWSDPAGNLYLLDNAYSVIRRVNVSTGTISVFGGVAHGGFSGDGGPALIARFNGPAGVTGDPAGNIYVADYGNNRIRKITVGYSLDSNTVTVTQTFPCSYCLQGITDNDFHKIANLNPTPGTNALAGNVTLSVNFDPSTQTYNGVPYVTRHFDATPASNASTAQATLTLYYQQSEFDAYNSYVTSSGLTLPLLPSGGVDNGNVQVTQYHGTGTAPGNYSGTSVLIHPTVTWNTTNNWWELTFPVTGFSGFYVSTGVVDLPLRLLDFTGVLNNGDALLKWETTDETGTRDFLIERSSNGSSFTTIGNVLSADSTGTYAYSYTDKGLPAGTWFYRLKMEDIDGKFSYSPIVALTNKTSASAMLLYPNPVKDRVYVQIQVAGPQPAVLRLVDLEGKVLQQRQVQLISGSNGFSFDTEGLARGVYFVTASGNQTQVIKFIKE